MSLINFKSFRLKYSEIRHIWGEKLLTPFV